jgi:hypothetical protein
LRERGVRLATPAGVYDPDDPQQMLLQNILSAIATFERSLILERTTAGRLRAIKNGGRPPNRLPLGYAWSAEAESIVVEEREAAVVRTVFEMAAQDGFSLRAIDRVLRQRGVRSGRLTAKKETFLAVATIRRLLDRETYWTGAYKPYEKCLPDHVRQVPTLVDKPTAIAARETLRRTKGQSRRKRSFPYLLVGLTRCAECGRSMRAHSVKKYAYYACEHASKPEGHEGRCGNNRSVRADETDELVWSVVTRMIKEPGALEAEVQRMVASELEDSRGETPEVVLRQIALELSRVDAGRARVVGLHRDGLIDRPELEVQLQEITRSRKPLLRRRQLMLVKAEAENERMARILSVEERLASMREVVDQMLPEERRLVVQELVDEVRIDGRRRSVEIRGILLTGEDPPRGNDEGAYGRLGGGGLGFSGVEFCSGSPAPARNSLLGVSIPKDPGSLDLFSPSIAARSPKVCLSRSCSDTKRAPLVVPLRKGTGHSKRPTWEPSSWTRLASCPRPRK